MAWRYKGDTDEHMIWECDFYTDLQKLRIDNFVHYSQPFSPYEHMNFHEKLEGANYPQGYNHDIKVNPDKQIVIQMPRQQIMTMGFGQQIELTDFPVIENFLDGDYDLPLGTHMLKNVIEKYNILKEKYKIKPSFYPFGGLSGNAIHMYIYGTTGFTLVPDRTTLTVTPASYSVRGYIFLTDDQWDYQSGSKFAKALNPLVQAIGGPSHNNLHPDGILIRYTGMGTYKQMSKLK